jgi:maltooligosyltrehalose trehalohydrolase
MSGDRFRFGPLVEKGLTRFRLWAPADEGVAVEVDDRPPVLMRRSGEGWRTAEIACGPGARYVFRVRDTRVPDPASRRQEHDVHGASIVTDPSSYRWRCSDWQGRPWEETVLYELHVGLCGGFNGVAAKLPELASLGITAVELMPVAEFPGARNWGYDGVLPFVPESAYGTPDELKALVDRAHELGLMMFLDVVYNHFGPDGNYLALYAPQFFRDDIRTPWGAAIDFRRAPVRRFFIENALYWLDEFRFDGLRFDAVHAISGPDWLDEMASAVRGSLPAERHVHLVLENDDNAASHLRRDFDAQWNDDIHHVLHALLTGERDGYYGDYADAPAERLARALREGFIYQGEKSPHRQDRSRGTSSADLPPTAFVAFLQNHDQTGNRALGERLTVLAHEDALKAAVALVLLSPQIPLIFMGDEIGSRAPFLYFTDHGPELADAVRKGRREEFAAFVGHAKAELPDPNAPETFEASRPETNAPRADKWRGFYRELLALRRERLMPHLAGARAVDAKAIGAASVVAEWRLGNAARLVIASNLGNEDAPASLPAAEPIWGPRSARVIPPRSTLAWIVP